jgi:protein phosphatase 1 regulatory subunit 3A/B/C/D/E
MQNGKQRISKIWSLRLHSYVLPILVLILQVSGSGTDQMTTERQACGLGSFLPMSCRGRAEAFARRLQSRLQSLGRAGSRDGASSPDDETSWLTRQPEVTSHQPRLSSSSESDIYFDFDLDCESPGSPIEEAAYSETLPDYIVNKNRAFHCPPRTQYSSESGCVSSPCTISGTSPDSDSSDVIYYDPENLDADFSSNHQNRKHDFSHESSRETGTEESSHNNGLCTENSPNVKMNGHILGLKQESSSPDEEHRRIVKRNFRNAAGFRVSREDKRSRVQTESDMKPVSISDLGSLSSEGSIADEYFECMLPKAEELSSGLKRLLDSGYPNTAESSRCNSQNETRENETNVCSSRQYEECSAVQNDNVSNGNLGVIPQRPKETSSETENSLIHSHPDICRTDLSNGSENQSTESCLDEGKSRLESLNEMSTDFPENSNVTCINSSSESLYTSTLMRPSNLTIECAIDLIKLDTLEHKETIETSDMKKNEDDDDDDENRPTPRVRRCSSLKSGKTPPGTPGRKKIVRFADVLGLDLADVRTFLDEIPKVPRSAYEDLQYAEMSDNAALSMREGTLSGVLLPTCISGTTKPDRCLIPLFQQPGGQLDFMDRVREDFVCLENAVVSDAVSYCISGTIRVRNLDFHKSVHIRYTLEGWKTFSDLQATYVPNSCDGFSDKFSFILYAHTVQVGQRVEFAIRFQCRGGQYWDSNRGVNYAFQCLPPADHASYLPMTMPMPIPISPDDHFPSSFY